MQLLQKKLSKNVWGTNNGLEFDFICNFELL